MPHGLVRIALILCLGLCLASVARAEGLRFKTEVDGLIHDSETGQDWRFAPTKMRVTEAYEWIKTLQASDPGWRLPLFIEIDALDASRNALAKFFPGVGRSILADLPQAARKHYSGFVLSSAVFHSRPLAYNFYSRAESPCTELWSDELDVFAVRGELPSTHPPAFYELQQTLLLKAREPGFTLRTFKRDADGVVSDPATGLQWYAGEYSPDLDRNVTATTVQELAKQLSVAGGGWRIPTLLELKSIMHTGMIPDGRKVNILAVHPIFKIKSPSVLCFDPVKRGDLYHFTLTDASTIEADAASKFAQPLAVRSTVPAPTNDQRP